MTAIDRHTRIHEKLCLAVRQAGKLHDKNALLTIRSLIWIGWSLEQDSNTTRQAKRHAVLACKRLRII